MLNWHFVLNVDFSGRWSGTLGRREMTGLRPLQTWRWPLQTWRWPLVIHHLNAIFIILDTKCISFRGRWGEYSAANCTLNGRIFSRKSSFFRGNSPLSLHFQLRVEERSGHEMCNTQQTLAKELFVVFCFIFLNGEFWSRRRRRWFYDGRW